MFCSHCGYHVEHSDSFCSGCGIAVPRRRPGRPGEPAFTELARDVRLLTGSRRAMKFAIIPLIAVRCFGRHWRRIRSLVPGRAPPVIRKEIQMLHFSNL